VIITAEILMLVNQQSQFIRDRTREYSLYKVLGSKSSEINVILFIENTCILLVGLIGGIASGILVTKTFVDTATFVAGAGDVISYYYDFKVMFIFSIYVTSIYIICLIIKAYSIAKSFSVYSLTNE